MRSLIARMIVHLPRWGRRRRTPDATGAPASSNLERRTHTGHGPHPAARRLAEAIDVSIARLQWERADRLARDAARIMHTSPRLTERVARLRLAQGRAETALAIVEAARFDSASLRLLRTVCLLELGRVAEAHLDLRAWSRKSTAPMEARRLLAMLECGWNASTGIEGDREAAVEALLQNLRQIEDPRTLQLLVVEAVAEERHEQAEHWAARLLLASRWCDERSHGVEPALLLESLGIDPSKIDRASPAASAQQIETLTMEMIATPSIERIMPALIRTMEHQPDQRAFELMYEAGRRALESLSDQAGACEFLARLAILLDRRQEAIDWANRGAEINPMSASLARLVHELAGAKDMGEASDADILKPERRKAA